MDARTRRARVCVSLVAPYTGQLRVKLGKLCDDDDERRGRRRGRRDRVIKPEYEQGGKPTCLSAYLPAYYLPGCLPAYLLPAWVPACLNACISAFCLTACLFAICLPAWAPGRLLPAASLITACYLHGCMPA